jgi:hypothetical protein
VVVASKRPCSAFHQLITKERALAPQKVLADAGT